VNRSLALAMIQRTNRATDPAPTITAPMPALDFVSDPDKGLTDNRDRYVRQSAETTGGVVAQLPPRPDH